MPKEKGIPKNHPKDRIKNEFLPEDVVWAKVPGHGYWPAAVYHLKRAEELGIKVAKGKLAVLFFATKEYSVLSPDNLWDYQEGKKRFEQPTKKGAKSGFHQAIIEANELIFGDDNVSQQTRDTFPFIQIGPKLEKKRESKSPTKNIPKTTKEEVSSSNLNTSLSGQIDEELDEFSESFFCEVCGEDFPTAEYRNEHMAQDHPAADLAKIMSPVSIPMKERRKSSKPKKRVTASPRQSCASPNTAAVMSDIQAAFTPLSDQEIKEMQGFPQSGSDTVVVPPVANVSQSSVVQRPGKRDVKPAIRFEPDSDIAQHSSPKKIKSPPIQKNEPTSKAPKDDKKASVSGNIKLQKKKKQKTEAELKKKLLLLKQQQMRSSGVKGLGIAAKHHSPEKSAYTSPTGKRARLKVDTQDAATANEQSMLDQKDNEQIRQTTSPLKMKISLSPKGDKSALSPSEQLSKVESDKTIKPDLSNNTNSHQIAANEQEKEQKPSKLKVDSEKERERKIRELKIKLNKAKKAPKEAANNRKLKIAEQSQKAGKIKLPIKDRQQKTPTSEKKVKSPTTDIIIPERSSRSPTPIVQSKVEYQLSLTESRARFWLRKDARNAWRKKIARPPSPFRQFDVAYISSASLMRQMSKSHMRLGDVLWRRACEPKKSTDYNYEGSHTLGGTLDLICDTLVASIPALLTCAKEIQLPGHLNQRLISKEALARTWECCATTLPMFSN